MDGQEKTVQSHVDGDKSTTMVDSSIGQTNTGSSKQKNDPTKPATSGRALQRKKKLRFQPDDVTFQNDEPHHEYYKDIGGEDMKENELPRAICVADKIESSVKEMKTMLRAVSQHTSNRAVLQKLPRHMRRRAASHNRKRLPRRFHQLAAEMSKDGDKPTKTVCRRKRRRNHNLQNEYAKRAGKQGWLETHMWHAKRFHMTETTDEQYSKWGNKVALHPNDKSFRACYRAVSKHCLIQDISYLTCLKLCGRHDALIQVFNLICTQPFTTAQLDGQEEADVLVSKISDEGVAECIGPVSVLWNPTSADKMHELFMWCHPTISSEVSDLLEQSSRKIDAPLEICDLSGELLRFRLTGPKSSITLLSIVRPLNIVPEGRKDTEIAKWMEKENHVIAKLHDEFVTTMIECHHSLFAREKKENSHLCPHGAVFPVVTDDPRLILPIDKTTPTLTSVREQIDQAMGCEQKHELRSQSEDKPSVQHFDSICRSPLWCDAVRNQVSSSRQPDHIVSTRRRQMKVIDDSEEHKKACDSFLSTPIPIIAIRKMPNMDRNDVGAPLGSNFASGWDLIIPKKWGTAFWIPLVYHRARTGGLRESHTINVEALKPHFPEDFPDTMSGQQWWEAEGNALLTKHYRRPPAKRINYSVTAIQSPFKPDWAGLLENSPVEHDKISSTSNDKSGDNPPTKKRKMDVMESEVLENVTASLPVQKVPDIDCSHECTDDTVPSDESVLPQKICVLRMEKDISQINSWMTNLLNSNTLESHCKPKFPENLQSSSMLVCVSVQALCKGVPFARATLSFPTRQDLDDLCSQIADPCNYGLSSVSGPLEVKHDDPYRQQRKTARKLAKSLKKAKKNMAEGKAVEGNTSTTNTKVVNKQANFPVAPSRKTIGYVTSGRFLYSVACGGGIGFITLQSLERLCHLQGDHHELGKLLKVHLQGANDLPLLALMRNVDSTQYRFVTLNVIKTW